MEKLKDKVILRYQNTIDLFSSNFNQLMANEGFIRYFKNTTWLFVSRVSTMIVSFFVGAYVARYLGPTQYGLLSYATSFVGLFAVLANFGIDIILARELIKYPEKRDELLGGGFLIKTIGSLLSVILIGITLLFIRVDWLTTTLIFLSAVVFFTNAFSVIDSYFQVHVLSKKTVVIQIISLSITTILKLLFIHYGANLIWFMAVYIVDGIILAIGFSMAYKKMGLSIYRWQFNYPTIKMLLKNSWPLMLSIAAINIYMKIDQVIIKQLIGTRAVGLYSAAARVSEIWYFIPSIICASLFPAIMNAKKTDPLVYKKRFRHLYSLMIYISVGIAIPITLLAGFIITKLFGADYIGSISVLKIHIWAGVGIFLGYAMSQFLIAENYLKIFFIVTLAGAISNIVLNLLLIPRYGINGSAIATLISYSIATFGIVFFRKTREQVLLMFKSVDIFSKNKLPIHKNVL